MAEEWGMADEDTNRLLEEVSRFPGWMNDAETGRCDDVTAVSGEVKEETIDPELLKHGQWILIDEDSARYLVNEKTVGFEHDLRMCEAEFSIVDEDENDFFTSPIAYDKWAFSTECLSDPQ
jgi:hypothetical protein